MQIHELTALARQMKASDIHLSEGLPLMFRVDGRLMQPPVQMSADETRSLILGLMDEAHREALLTERIDADFALVAPDGTRSRVNVFFQQGRAAATLRLLNDAIPTLAELSMPPVLTKLADEPRGLILVTGPTGSGKSTTLAAMIDHINETRSDHIITIEDPIEYVYTPDLCVINQREVGKDTASFSEGLRASLREDPDVILIGEMRDKDTIETAITAAETGHLVFGTLHTGSASDAIDRMVQVFPEGMQNQIRLQLSMTLMAVISQQLVKRKTGGRVLASEVMVVTDGIRNMIRSGNTPQIANAIATSAGIGGQTMDQSLVSLVRSRQIDKNVAVDHANDVIYVKKNA